MNTETQLEGSITPGIEALADSEESKKSKKGGKRPGAGRKPNPAKILLKGVTRGTLLQALERVPAELVAGRIKRLLNSKREIIWLQTLNFIYDRILGKPKQDVNVSGAFIHAETRDPQLLGWPKEALTELAASYDRAYRDVSSKFGLVAQDGPYNQVESSTALLPAVAIASEPSSTNEVAAARAEVRG